MSQLIKSRADFQKLAEDRLNEAKALLDAGMWDGAYYLAGYAVELALKACIIKHILGTDAFPDKRFSEKCYTHSLEQLVVLAQLYDERQAATEVNPNLLTNWTLTQAWTEEKRYHRIDRVEAETLFAAITDDTDGVLAWVKRHY